MLSCRKEYEERKATRKSKTSDFFAWTDKKVELLLKVIHKAVIAIENIDWELHRGRHSMIKKTQ